MGGCFYDIIFFVGKTITVCIKVLRQYCTELAVQMQADVPPCCEAGFVRYCFNLSSLFQSDFIGEPFALAILLSELQF